MITAEKRGLVWVLCLILLQCLIPMCSFRGVGASRTIYVPQDFGSIQSAVNNATPGDTVSVTEGVYYENIVVNKSLSLIGKNRSKTIIDASGSGSVIKITGIRVQISGFTLRNSGSGWPNSGIEIVNSYLNIVSDNIIRDNHIGVLVESSPNNYISGNNITANHYGIYIRRSDDNQISNNHILYSSPAGGGAGIALSSSNQNVVEGNLIQGSGNVAVALTSSQDNSFYYNNLVDNKYQVSLSPEDYVNTWDAGYPQGGNFWSDYSGPDVYTGPHQNETGSDGIIDSPYIINQYNKDRYPRLKKVVAFHDVAVDSITPSESKIYQGQLSEIYVQVANNGNYTETFSVTVYYDVTPVDTKVVDSLPPHSISLLTFTWNTTGVPEGIYAIQAEAHAVQGEKDTTNNFLSDGSVMVRSYALTQVKLESVTPCNQSGHPVSSFETGAIAYFKVVLNNTSTEPEMVLITVNAFDTSDTTLGVVSFKSTVMPGESTFILGLPISSTTSIGTATVYGNAFTNWPYLGGLPYSPEVSATFQVTSY